MAHPKHILVVDDDGDVRNFVVDMLREHGHWVSGAIDGKSMRDILTLGVPFDAIILDALMPGESGKDLALHAKELGLPLVMISGSPEVIQFTIEHGLQLLEKPFRMSELFDALDQAIGGGKFGHRGAQRASTG